jgi:hypothetical protein
MSVRRDGSTTISSCIEENERREYGNVLQAEAAIAASRRLIDETE